MKLKGCWLAFSGLLAAMAVQGLLHRQPSAMAGEWFVFMALCVYLLIQEFRYGLWDWHLKANVWTNLAVSLLAGIAVGVFGLFAWAYWNWVGAVITGASTALLCFGALQLSVWIWKRRRHQLDDENNSGEESRSIPQ